MLLFVETPMTTVGTASQSTPVRPSTAPARSRIQAVDALRGGVIILMALDHIRDFTSSAAMSFSPTDLTRTTAAIFFTRWVTHFCAPVFAFTAGIGAFLWLQRGRTKRQLSGFLVTRGLWLILLELTVLRFIMFSSFQFRNSLVILLVLWMLGLCMIALAALLYLPTRILLPLSLAIIAGHNLLDSISPSRFGRWAWLWDILHQQAVFRFGSNNFLTAYPLIPWVAVMAAGYCFGPALLWDSGRRQRFLIRLGLAVTTAFVLLRLFNRYGDPQPWSAQHSALFTCLSFLNCTKYPPSLLFLLMTLGPALLVMAWLERVRLASANPLIVFGRVPFFFYVGHLAVAHALAIVMNFFRYGSAKFLLLPPPSMGGPRELFPSNFGYDLWVVYVVWIAVVGALYPLCRWFAQLKQQRREWWLSYL
jgi:uncharacterized membrane protein